MSLWPIRIATTALLALMLSACSVYDSLFPSAAEIDKIHEVYRTEFTKSLVLPNGSKEDNLQTKATTDFDQTLTLISAYRRNHNAKEKPTELDHLTMLEGMIYLQEGQYGLAGVLKDNIAKIKAKYDDRASTYDRRDVLFAQNFTHLIAGWEAADPKNVGTHSLTIEDRAKRFTKFFDAANEICTNLVAPARRAGADQPVVAKDFPQNSFCRGRLFNPPSDRLAGADVDDGAVYLASSADVFYAWSRLELDNYCSMLPTNDPANLGKLKITDAPADLTAQKCHAWRRVIDSAAACLLGKFLSDNERKISLEMKTDELSKGTLRPGRLRYLDLYRYFRFEDRVRKDDKGNGLDDKMISESCVNG